MNGLASFMGFSGTEHSPSMGPQKDDASDAAVAPGHPGRILIVEDDYMVALSNEWALTDAGFEILQREEFYDAGAPRFLAAETLGVARSS